MMLAERFSIGPEDVAYIAMPMFHSNALIAGWSIAVAGGASIALRRRFSARGFADDVHRYGITFANYVGTLMRYILATEPHPTTRRRHCGSCTATRPRLQTAPHSPNASRLPGRRRFRLHRKRSRDHPHPDTPTTPSALREPNAIVDPDTGTPVPPGTVGEIVNASGPGLSGGYYNDPEATEDRLRGGIYHRRPRLGRRRRLHPLRRPHRRLAARRRRNLGTQTHRTHPPAPSPDSPRRRLRHPGRDRRRDRRRPVADDLTAEALTDFLATQPDLGPKQWPHPRPPLDTLPQTATFKTVKTTPAPQASSPTWTLTNHHYT